MNPRNQFGSGSLIQDSRPISKDNTLSFLNLAFGYPRYQYEVEEETTLEGVGEKKESLIEKTIQALSQGLVEKIADIMGNTPSYVRSLEKIAQVSRLISEYDQIVYKLKDSTQEEIGETNVTPDVYLPVDSSEAKDIIASIRAAFGFTTKDLADVLQVKRQTIYAWIRGENEPSDDNSRRIRSAMAFAEEWNRLSTLPAKKYLRIEFEKGTTLLEELCRETYDPDMVRHFMQQAAKLIREADEQRNQKIRVKSAVQGSEYDMLTLDAFIPNETE